MRGNEWILKIKEEISNDTLERKKIYNIKMVYLNIIIIKI